jgi:hypothetical protein
MAAESAFETKLKFSPKNFIAGTISKFFLQIVIAS